MWGRLTRGPALGGRRWIGKGKERGSRRGESRGMVGGVELVVDMAGLDENDCVRVEYIITILSRESAA
jgi:hypothetical protein